MKHRIQPAKRLLAPQPPADPWAAWDWEGDPQIEPPEPDVIRIKREELE